MVTGSEEAYEARVSGFSMEVRLLPRWRGLEEAVWELIRWVVPANIEARVVPVFRSHGVLGAMTHRAMGAHTHWQLRNEVEIA